MSTGSRNTDPGDGASADPGFDVPGRPAVAPLDTGEQRRASSLVESPARTVAVLDDADRKWSIDSANDGERSQDLAAGTAGKPEKRNDRLRWLLGLVTAGLVAVLALLFINGSGDSVASVPDFDAAQEDRVRDLESGGLDDVEGQELTTEDTADIEEELANEDQLARVTDPNTLFSAADGLTVGSLTVANGVPLLRELAAWHETLVDVPNRELGEGNGCWLAQLGGSAVQEAHCGPVGMADGDYLFDLVPVVFDDVGDGQIAVPILDAIAFDALVPNTVESIGLDETPFVFPPAE